MPEVAANAVEAVLQEWPIAENTPFSAKDTIAIVETDKAIIDIEAETDGVILKTLVPAGSAIEVGKPIAILGDSRETISDIDAVLAQLGVAEIAAPSVPQRQKAPEPPEPVAPAAAHNKGTIERIFASPLARRLAHNAQLPIEEITGTGPGGRIVRRDVEAAIANRAMVGQTPLRGEPAAAAQQGTYTDQPHSRIRKAIAFRMTESKTAIPHFYLRGTADVDKLLELREQLNHFSPVKISVNDMVIKAAAAAHCLVPAMNVIWTADAIRCFSSVDISVAIATEHGLVTPVLRAVERLPISRIATDVQNLAARAKTGRLRQGEIEGGSLTITNLGMYGTEEFTAIINPPQSAILAVGAARQEPVARNGELTVGTLMRLNLSVDHRAVDGAVAAQWMHTFVSLMENPLQILVL